VTEQEARTHPQRSLVLAALDGDPARRPAVQVLPARLGDRLLLCSDGLSDVLALEEIGALLDGDDAADRLVRAALEAGARDNVSVVVADVVERRDAAAAWQPPLAPAAAA
jgi:protein phosphatase